jgi:hypothetical protein
MTLLIVAGPVAAISAVSSYRNGVGLVGTVVLTAVATAVSVVIVTTISRSIPEDQIASKQRRISDRIAQLEADETSRDR